MENATLRVENDYIILYNDTQTRYFDKEGKELKNTQVYKDNKLFIEVKDNKYGFVDKEGNKVVEYKYDKAYEFNEYGYAAVKKDGKWGVIDSNGKEVISPCYEFEEKIEPLFIRKVL